MPHHPSEIIRRLFPLLFALVCVSWVVACVAPPYEPPGGEASDSQSGDDTGDSSEPGSDDDANNDNAPRRPQLSSSSTHPSPSPSPYDGARAASNGIDPARNPFDDEQRRNDSDDDGGNGGGGGDFSDPESVQEISYDHPPQKDCVNLRVDVDSDCGD